MPDCVTKFDYTQEKYKWGGCGYSQAIFIYLNLDLYAYKNVRKDVKCFDTVR